MPGTRYRKVSQKRWTLTWALLLSVYMAIFVTPTASAAVVCAATGTSSEILTVTLNGSDATVTVYNATGTASVAVSGCASGVLGGEYPVITTLSIIGQNNGADPSETVTFDNASDSAWTFVTTMDVNLGTSSGDEVTLLGTTSADSIDASTLFDSLTNVEVLNIFGLQDDDSLTGRDGLPNVISGGDGDDSLTGGDGDDELSGDAGVDTIDGDDGDDVILEDSDDLSADVLSGGGDTDTLSYGGRAAGVVVHLDSHAGEDNLSAGDIEDVVGTDHDDVIYGDALDNSIEAGAGYDEIHGGSGDDTFMEGSDDVLTDLIYGGADADTVDYDGRLAGLVVDLDPSNAPAPGAPTVSEDTFDGSVENVVGTDFSDQIFGLAGAANELSGGAGNDLLDGGSGAFVDILSGGDGADTLRAYGDGSTIAGDGGTDVVNYAGATGPVCVELADPALGSCGGTSADDFDGSVENLIGSPQDDVINGTSSANQLRGGDGQDAIYGWGGKDSIYGEGGNDGGGTNPTAGLFGGDGNDIVVGGQGDDTMVGEGGDDSLDGTKDGIEDQFFGGTNAIPPTDVSLKDKCAVESSEEKTHSSGCELFTGLKKR